MVTRMNSYHYLVETLNTRSTPQQHTARRGAAMRGLDMPLRMGYGRVSRVSRGSGSRDHRFEDAEGGLGGGPMLRS
jgi:hypothetical protein